MQVLENERFRVEINEFGAELTRFTSKKDGTEYVWKGDPAAWKRHAPILFPIVGRLKDKTYTVDGRPYEITQHGFGRDLAWQAQKISGTCAEFTLTPSEYTKKMYPWDFICTVRYTLDGNALKKEHIVKNTSDSVMYYENVMLTADRVSVPLTDGRLPISRELFANDAVMTEGLPFRTATIASTKNRRRVTMDFTDFDYFAVWSPYKDFEVPFVCLEPWSTLPDGNHLDHAIEHKQGIRKLHPNESETLTFTTIIDE